MLAGIILLMIASMVVYGFYLKYFYFSKPGYRQKPASSSQSSPSSTPRDEPKDF